jgi:hypothetical protein
MIKTLITAPVGPWKKDATGESIYRRADESFIIVDLVHYHVARYGSTPFFKGKSLGEAVARADLYIEDNFKFEPEKTTEQKLSDALAEIELLKQELRVAVRRDSHESAKELKVGQRVRVPGVITTIDRVTQYAGATHYDCTVNGSDGLYTRADLEPA